MCGGSGRQIFKSALVYLLNKVNNKKHLKKNLCVFFKFCQKKKKIIGEINFRKKSKKKS